MRTRTTIAVLLLTAGLVAGAEAAPPSQKGPTPKPQAKSAPEAPRRLQDIHIEGEIPVPQVLFITARDQRRYTDFEHRRYLKTSMQIGEATVFPSWIAVVGSQPAAPQQKAKP